MIRSLLSTLRGSISLLLYGINTVVLVPPLLVVALFKWIIPHSGWRRGCDKVLNGIAGLWISINNWNIRYIHRVRWDISGLENLSPDQWYMVLANHQSWVDILVLQAIFHKRIPFLKFFLKKELIWVPFLGLAWWALDFPFMKRYSRSFIEKHPHLKGRDLEITRKACEKFKTIPVSITNFVEGTRFHRLKQEKQGSPYQYLLRPKAGGLAFVMSAMGDHMQRILDVTIAYPNGAKTFWEFVCGKIGEIRVKVRSIPIDDAFRGDYLNDPQFRERMQQRLNAMWAEKDRLMQTMMKQLPYDQDPVKAT